AGTGGFAAGLCLELVPKMNSRQMYVVRPQGTFYVFKWRKYTAEIKTSSGSGTVFSPTGIQFRVVAS
ncbi:hypothetical protein, partial [Glutamicibacter arilaitensis]|uniref:hypothetical protein n=1 Tax=Glutamicibacter arilaitensis TaxID=256701 RepID=UPI003FCFE79A